MTGRVRIQYNKWIHGQNDRIDIANKTESSAAGRKFT